VRLTGVTADEVATVCTGRLGAPLAANFIDAGYLDDVGGGGGEVVPLPTSPRAADREIARRERAGETFALNSRVWLVAPIQARCTDATYVLGSLSTSSAPVLFSHQRRYPEVASAALTFRYRATPGARAATEAAFERGPHRGPIEVEFQQQAHSASGAYASYTFAGVHYESHCGEDPSGHMSAWSELRSAGTATLRQVGGVRPNSFPVHLGDVDGDGMLEVLYLNQETSTVALYMLDPAQAQMSRVLDLRYWDMSYGC
jgi:hypothetical protein